MPETEKAVIDYDAAIHGYSYTAHAPIVQVLLRAASTKIGYEDFRGVTLQKARVSVDVSAVTSLNLESDGGSLDPKKAFLPFGPQPTRGSRFMVGYDEALSKKLSELKIKVQWKDAPANFVALYEQLRRFWCKQQLLHGGGFLQRRRQLGEPTLRGGAF